MSARLARPLAGALLALTGLLCALGLGLSLAFPDADVSNRLGLPFGFLSPMASAVVGGLIVVRQARNTVGWLLLLIGLVGAALSLTEVYEPIVNANPAAPVGLDVRRAISDLTWVASIGAICLILQLFPAGRPLSPRWRYLAWFTAIWALSGAVAALSGLQDGSPAQPLFLAPLPFLLLTSVVSILIRTAKASGVERQQSSGLRSGRYPGSSSSLWLPLSSPKLSPSSRSSSCGSR